MTVDTIAPQITVSSPQSGSVTNHDKITISGYLVEDYPHQITLSGGSTGPVPGKITGNSFYFKDILLSEGENAFTLNCQDKAGNSSQSNITVTRDSQPPQLTVQQPLNNAVLPYGSVLVKGTASDNENNLKEVRVNNYLCPVDNTEFSLVLNLAEGPGLIEIKALDLAGNLKTETLQVTVDSTAPNLNLTAPTANAFLNTPNVMVSGRVDDSQVSNVIVKVNGQTIPVSSMLSG